MRLAATGWSCKMVPDERAALESEIGRLQRDNAELKKSLLARGLELPNGIVAEAPAAPAPVPPANVPDPSAKEPKGAERGRSRPRLRVHEECLAPAGRHDGRSAAGHAAQELTESPP